MKRTMAYIRNEGNEFVIAHVNLNKITHMRIIVEQYDHYTTCVYVLEIYVGCDKPIRVHFTEKGNAVKEFYRITEAVDAYNNNNENVED